MPSLSSCALLLSLTLTLPLFPFPALAVCPVIQPTVVDLTPASAATGVPRNGVVAFGTSPAFAGYEPSVTLTATGGAAVPGALLSGPAGSWIFRPDDDLADGVSYSVQVSDAAGAGAPASTSFTVGPASDLVDPVIAGTPVLTLGSYAAPVRTDDCQLPGYWKVRVDWEDAVDAGPVLYVLDVEIVDLVDTGLLPGGERYALTAVASERLINVPEESELRVSVFAVDAAGRQGHSAIATLDTPAAPIGGGGCGCALAERDPERGASALVLMGGLVLLGWRRAAAAAARAT